MWTSEPIPSLNLKPLVELAFKAASIGLGFSFVKLLFSRISIHSYQYPALDTSSTPQSIDIEDETPYSFCIYAGESLTDEDVSHFHVLLDEGAYEGIQECDPNSWAIFLFVISQEIAA